MDPITRFSVLFLKKMFAKVECLLIQRGKDRSWAFAA